MKQSLLIKNAHVLVTMDQKRREIRDGGVYVEGAEIVAVGPTHTLPASADRVIDAKDHVVLPGLINTHHHMYQSLTRALPGGQDASLFAWLIVMYEKWVALTPEMMNTASKVAIAELLLSGGTTSSDMQPIYPNGCRLDDSIEVAREMGIRFHASRGAVTLGKRHGSIIPDEVCEQEDDIFTDTERLIARFHDREPLAMCRVVMSPISPFQVTPDMMRRCAQFARLHGISMHTHLAENEDDIRFSLERFGKTPAAYVEDVEWVGPDVWHAHCVKLDEDGIRLFAKTGTGVAHCPCSNMRLGSGIPPIRRMLCEGVPVGLGVDGSASSDSGHMLGEARQAMLLARVAEGADAMTARQALELATLGGARVLARDDIGALRPGMAADIIGFDLNGLDFAGAWHDPVAALVFCFPGRVSFSVIQGRTAVSDGALVGVDLPALIAKHNQNASVLMNA